MTQTDTDRGGEIGFGGGPVNFVQVAAGPDSWKYGLHPEHVAQGWAWRVGHALKAAEAMGGGGAEGERATHVWHLPLGRPTDGRAFALDMAPVLRADPDPRYRRLVDGFAAAARTLTRNGHRVIAYLGCLQALEPWNVEGKRDDLQRRLAESLKPVLDGGCEAAIDASVVLAEGSWGHGTMIQQRAFVPRLWLEAWPADSMRHWEGWPVMSAETDWAARPERRGGITPMPRERLGPVLRHWNYPKPDGESDREYAARLPDRLAEFAASCRAERCTPAWDVLAVEAVCPGLAAEVAKGARG